MKKLKLLMFLMVCIAGSNCWHHQGDINISYQENDRYYSMKADYSDESTRAVEEYMNDQIGSSSNMSFTNTRIDGQLALDDHTTFYIKKKLGFLEIKLDKHKNSIGSYEKIRSMCEGFKKVMKNEK